MADPAEWRELAAQFRELARIDQHALYAVWSAGSQWVLSGTTDEHIQEHFKAYAERGSILAGGPRGPASLSFWLDKIKEESPYYTQDNGSEIWSQEEVHMGVGSPEVGSLRSVCLASAEYCYKLETTAISASVSPLVTHRPSMMERATYATFDAQIRAQAQVEYERTLEKLRQQSEPLTAKESIGSAEAKHDSVGTQLHRLRKESDLTVEALAEALRISVRSVNRHLSDEALPQDRHLARYERIFSQALGRKVVISKTS